MKKKNPSSPTNLKSKISKPQLLRALMVEDSEDDALLIIRELKKGGYDPEYERVETATAMKKALQEKQWDIILCDYKMPKFSGLAAIALLKETNIDIPLIIVSGTIGEDVAVNCMLLGANDYIMKDKLSRLVPAIERELKESTSRIQGKRAEDALKESENRYRLLVENINEVIYTLDIGGRFTYVSPVIEKFSSYKTGDLIGKNFIDFVHPDDLPGLIENFNRTVQGELEPFEYRILDGDKVRHIRTSSQLILKNGASAGLTGVMTDINDRKKAEEKLKQTLESLRRAVGTTIQVMVSAIEARDPYTSGHQLRSANLACAIATEMGLPSDKIEGLQMAGSIHDIGKLSIPAEILSKPTKLTNLEFSLIKEHSRKGYEMLKDVESPWPLAEIVYQHHERMDGSGYPRNLKGDEILIEARIMAVADVLEAMASNRPYRPGLGIDEALTEIEKNKGTFYDNTVADACLRLFREKGFQLEIT